MSNSVLLICIIGVLAFGAPIFLDPSYFGKVGFLALLLSFLTLFTSSIKDLLLCISIITFGYLTTGDFLNHTFLSAAVFVIIYRLQKQITFNWIFKAVALANVINLVIWALVSSLKDSPSESWLYPSGHPNLFSSYLFLSSIVIIYAIQTEKYDKRGWIIVSINLLVITVIGSIASILSIALGAISFFIPWNKLTLVEMGIRARVIGLTLFFFIGFWAVLPSILSSSILHLEKNESNTSIAERSMLWRNSYLSMDRAALLGKGAGSWPIDYLEKGYPKIYRARELRVFFQRPHNEFIRVYFEYGLIGLGALSFFLAYILALAYSIAKSNSGLRVVYSGLVGFLVPMIFSFPLERVEHTVLLSLICMITLKQHHEIA